MFDYYLDFLIEKLSANRIQLHIQIWFAFLYKYYLVDKAFKLVSAYFEDWEINLT